MKSRIPAHLYAVGDLVSFNAQQGEILGKLNPFTVEAQMPPVGVFLQYRIKSVVETCRRVVAEHQLTSASPAPAIAALDPAPSGFDESD